MPTDQLSWCLPVRAIVDDETATDPRRGLASAMVRVGDIGPRTEAVMKMIKLLSVGVGVGALAFALAPPVHQGARATSGLAPSLSSRQLAQGTLDPRHLPRVLPHGIFRASTSTAKATPIQPHRSINGLINSDMAIYVSDGSTFTSLAAEGHLTLTSNDGG